MVNLDDHVVEVDGRRYVKYGGLILMAHDQGLARLTVQMVQHPSPDNGTTAIVVATCEMKDSTSFSDLGDASPASVGDPRLVPHLLRVASTRAKARCLRDALGIGMTCIEELSADGSLRRPVGVETPALLATPKQLAVLRLQVRRLCLPAEAAGLNHLTKKEASDKIREYNRLLQRGASPGVSRPPTSQDWTTASSRS